MLTLGKAAIVVRPFQPARRLPGAQQEQARHDACIRPAGRARSPASISSPRCCWSISAQRKAAGGGGQVRQLLRRQSRGRRCCSASSAACRLRPMVRKRGRADARRARQGDGRLHRLHQPTRSAPLPPPPPQGAGEIQILLRARQRAGRLRPPVGRRGRQAVRHRGERHPRARLSRWPVAAGLGERRLATGRGAGVRWRIWRAPAAASCRTQSIPSTGSRLSVSAALADRLLRPDARAGAGVALSVVHRLRPAAAIRAGSAPRTTSASPPTIRNSPPRCTVTLPLRASSRCR